MKILFVGNSFTARNDMPGTLAALAEAAGMRIGHELVAAGGASLRAHWNRGEALAAIRRTPRDYVVLQEQSTLPLKNARRMHENIRLFAGPIAESGARMALYATWARRNAPDAQAAITGAYETIAAELGATVIPVGRAWHALAGGHDGTELYDRDMSHPSPAGSYLAACVFFSVLFRRSPMGLSAPAAGLTETATMRLQEAAWRAASLAPHDEGDHPMQQAPQRRK